MESVWTCKTDCEVAGGSRDKLSKHRDFRPNTTLKGHGRIVPQRERVVEAAKEVGIALAIFAAYLLGSLVAS